MHRASAAVRILVPALLLALASTSTVRAQSEVFPSGFELVPVIVDVFEPGRPVDFAQIPDGRFLIIERNTGNVRVFVDGSADAPIVYTVAGVTIEQERGLLGIAVDPAWPARPYVYLYYTYETSVSRLTMFTITGDLTDPASTNLTFTSPFDLLSDIPDDFPIHNGGTIRFGPDGMLYLSLGDDGYGCNAQDLTILLGGILRLDVSGMPEAGSGPPPKADITPVDNPFPGPDPNERLFWVWGLRNPFRCSLDPATGDLFIGDVGLTSFEEIDRASYHSGAGANFGWPQREGFIDPMLGLTCGLDNTFTDPIYAYPHDPGLTAIVGGPMYRSNAGAHAFPVEYDGRLFFAEFYSGWIRCLQDVGGTWALAPPVAGQPDSVDWATGFTSLSDLQVEPDGGLYAMKLIPVTGRGSGLYRIQPSTSTAAVTTDAAVTSLECTPNPSRVATGSTIRWNTALASAWNLRIVDAAGRVVRTAQGKGATSWRWDGRDSNGRRLAAGVYFLSVRSNGRSVEGKVVLLR
jgi:glucose/arabinose dehydrogenase